MGRNYAELMFTDAVTDLQRQDGSAGHMAAMARSGPDDSRLGENEQTFIESRDSIFLTTVSASGFPYVQHRGGPPGFLRVLEPDLVGFADFAGNRQFVSAGNTRTNDRAALFLIDHGLRARLKIVGHLSFEPLDRTSDHPTLKAIEGYRARVQRLALFRIAGFEWNCSQHIPQRFGVADVRAASEHMLERIAALEAEVQRLKAG
jgi:uncharacterized protein